MKRLRQRAALSALAAFLWAGAAASVRAAPAGDPLSRTERALWTTCTITLYDHEDAKTLDAAFRRLHEIDREISVNTPGSELDAVSAQAGRSPVRVSGDVLFVAHKALQLAALSGGLFDPTVGPLIRAWKIDRENPVIPTPAAIAAARALVGWKDVVLDEAAHTIYLRRPGMLLDLGALGKGFAADEMVTVLSSRGVSSAIIDLGGNIFALGSGPAEKPWRIGIQNPDAARGVPLGIVRVVNESVVTSGVYEHFFVKDGKRYHHIMDTRTGYPVDNGVESATVISQNSMDADGLATTLICLGTKDGIALAKKLGVQAIMVDSARRVFVTPETKKIFTITDSAFTYAD